MAEKEINPITGTPLDGSTLVDSTSNGITEGEVLLNPITGTPLNEGGGSSGLTIGGSNPDLIISGSILGSQNITNKSRGQDISRYTNYNVPLGQLLDWDEIRARNQSTAEKWGHGLAKAGVTTLGAVAENTVGFLAGVGEMISGGSYYDNSVGKSVDKMNAWMQEYMPNYRTEEERNMSTFQKLGTANMWAETVAGGLGYSVGSIATMWLTGGGGLITKGVAGAAKGLGIYNASKAIINGTALAGKIGKGAQLSSRLLKAAQLLEAGAMMSLAEASVESRGTQKEVYNDMVEKYLHDNPGSKIGDIPVDMLKDFEDVSYSAANTNFAIQLPVLMGSNLLMFGKQVSGFKAASKVNADVILESGKAVNKLATKGFLGRTASKIKPVVMNGLEETFQESVQFGSGAFASQYHKDKYYNGGHGDMATAFAAAGNAMISQEGLESALVGFLTGGIMGGGQSIVGKEYTNRVNNAETLTTLINSTIFDNSVKKSQTADASSAVAARMQEHLKNGDIKKFKDEQHNLLQYQALEALERGGFDVMLAKIEDSKGMSESEFMKAYGYPQQDAKGTPLTLKDSTDKTQDEVIEGFTKKLKSFEGVYKNVNERFPLADKTTGLPRMLMSEEARKAEDIVYAKQENLRSNLILYGSGVKDRVRRMDEIAKDMQRDLDESLVPHGLNFSTSNNPRGDKNLTQAIKDQYETPGEVEASEYDAKKQYTNTLDRFNTIIEKLSKTDTLAASKFKEKAQDYLKLLQENNNGIDSYNRLASDTYVQEAMHQEIARIEEAAKREKADATITEAIEKGQSSDDFKDIDLKSASPKIEAAGRKKLTAFKDEEAAENRKYMEEKAGETPQDHLKRLEDIDKTDLTPAQKVGLRTAINTIKAELEEGPKNEEEEIEDPNEEEVEVEESFLEKNIGGVEDFSDDGRAFTIEGIKYTNDKLNPLDAIDRDKNGKVVGISLVDSQGNSTYIYGPEARLDTLAYAISMSEQFKVDSEQGLIREDILEDAAIALEEANKALASEGVHGAKTSESLQLEIHNLALELNGILELRDNLRTHYIQEAGATKAELKQDPDLKELDRKSRSLRTQIGQRKRILKLRGESASPTTTQQLKVEREILESIHQKTDEIKLAENNITRWTEEVETYSQELDRYKEEKDFDSYKQVKEDIRTIESLIQEESDKIQTLDSQINHSKNKLDKFKNEEDNQLNEDAESAEPGAAEEIEGPNNEGEDTNLGEVTEEKGTTLDSTEEPSQESYTNEELETQKQAERVQNSNANNNADEQSSPGAPVQQGFIIGNNTGLTEAELRGETPGPPVQQGFQRGLTQGMTEAELAALESTQPTSEVTGPITHMLDMPDKYKITSVTSNTDPNSKRVTDKLVTLGNKISDENIHWEVGKLRANISGRKIVDILIPSTGQSFLFYKSTGTGTGAQSKGVWVPLPGFAQNGWFIKNFHNGINPKVNMYEVPVFKTISKYLSKKETVGVEAPTQQTSQVVKAPLEGVSNAAIAEMSDENYKELVETGYTVWLDENGEASDASYKPTQQSSEVNKGIDNTASTDLQVKAANIDQIVLLGRDKEDSQGNVIERVPRRIQVDYAGNPRRFSPDTDNGNIIKINQELLLDPDIKNKTVTFEVRPNDHYTKKGDENSESWKHIPIYYKIGNEYVGKLEISDSLDRKYIVDMSLEGMAVTTTISDIMSGAKNVNHAVDEGGNPFFFHPEETFGKNELIIAVANKDKGIFQTGPVDEFLDQGDLDLIEAALDNTPISKDRRTIGSGQAVAVIRPKHNPQGDPRITPLSTANLDATAQNIVLEALKNKDFDKVKSIIANSSVPSESPTFLEVNTYPDGSNALIYMSPSTGNLVRIKDYHLTKALNNEEYKYDFVKSIDDRYVVYKPKGGKTVDIPADLRKFVESKKYNVDANLINLAADYRSPITNKLYESTADRPFGYQQYLMSSEEMVGNRILSTDVVKMNGSMFNNPGVTFNKIGVINQEGGSETGSIVKNTLGTTLVRDKSIQFEDISDEDMYFDDENNSCI